VAWDLHKVLGQIYDFLGLNLTKQARMSLRQRWGAALLRHTDAPPEPARILSGRYG